MYPYSLEKGSKKYACPSCGRKSFKRVVELATSNYLPEYVGRCDHESSCGYEFTWTRYLKENPEIRPSNVAVSGAHTRPRTHRSPNYIESQDLKATLNGYRTNAFVQFLLKVFDSQQKEVFHVISEYLIGTKNGFTVFPTIDRKGRVCKGKLIKFNPETGKRIKEGYSISSLEYLLKKAGRISRDFETDKEVFFGEHLTQKYCRRPIGIVEAEKTAVIASICNRAFPSITWLAAGSKCWLKPHRIRSLGQLRKIILYPDADGFQLWQQVASESGKLGMRVSVSRIIENCASENEKRMQVDLADYLINLQLNFDEASRGVVKY